MIQDSSLIWLPEGQRAKHQISQSSVHQFYLESGVSFYPQN